MISGMIVLEDHVIQFASQGDNTVTFTITEEGDARHNIPSRTESGRCPQDAFLKALAIAVHNDGMPDAEADYPAAEAIMGTIRWIP